MKTAEEIIWSKAAHAEYPSYYNETDIEDMMEVYAEQFKPQWVPVQDVLTSELINNLDNLYLWDGYKGVTGRYSQSDGKFYGYLTKSEFLATHCLELPGPPNI